MNATVNNTILGFDYWGIHQDADRRFRKILINVLGITCLFFIGLPFWVIDPISDIEKAEPEEYYLEIVQPAPIVKPKVTLAKAPEKKAELPKPVEQIKAAAPVLTPPADSTPERKTKTNDVAAAKKVAAASGVMAFSEQLAVLRDTDAKAMLSSKPLRDRGSVVEEMRSSSSNILSTSTRGVDGGVDNGENISDQGSKIAIGKHSTQKIVASGGAQSVAAGKSGSLAAGPQGRSLEEIQLAFDRSKSAFYAIFNRAARSDSTIGAGTVVVSLTIQPDGTVSDCSVVSSSFFNPELKDKLIQRVKQIRFESKAVPVFVYGSYPISYVPR